LISYTVTEPGGDNKKNVTKPGGDNKKNGNTSYRTHSYNLITRKLNSEH